MSAAPNANVVYSINPSTPGVVQQPYTLTGFVGAYSIASDPTYLWVSAILSSGGTDLVRISLGDGSMQTFAPAAGYTSETGSGQIVDAANYLYTSAWGDTAVVRISKADGSITYVAGNPLTSIEAHGSSASAGSGFSDGTASNAWFNGVVGLATDGTNIWAGDSNNYRFREVLAGSQTTAPPAIPSLNVPNGDVSTFAGSGQNATVDGVGTKASFSVLGGVAIVAGTVYVASFGAVRKVGLSGNVSTLTGGSTAGCVDSPTPSAAQITYGSAMATDGSYLYVADKSCNTIWKISLSTGSTAALGLQNLWVGLTYGPDGFLYGVDGTTKVVYRIDPVSGATTTPFTLTGNTSWAIGSDSTSLWVAEQNNSDPSPLCRQYTYGCTNLVQIALPGGAMTTFTPPMGTSMTGQGQLALTQSYLYTLAPGGTEIQQISKSTGAVSVLAGQPYTQPGFADGVGPAAQFNGSSASSGIATDGFSLWVGDSDNFRLRRVVAAPAGSGFLNSEHFGAGNLAQLCVCKQGGTNFTPSPVNAQTGNFWHTFDDLAIPGRGMALDFQRSYNSDPSSLAAPAGLFGPGWSFSYSMSLSGLGTGTVTVHQENGSTVAYSANGSTFTATSTLTEATLTAVGANYVFQRQGQDSFTFDSTGRLIAETDLNGYVTRIDHSNPNQLVVTDPANRTLTATISGGHISALSDGTRTVQYQYNDGQGNLTDVIDVNGGHSQYSYDGGHRLTTMRSARYYGDNTTSPTPVVTNHYDTSGRVDWQSDQLGRTTSFDYTSHPGSTLVTDPKGNVTQQTFLGGLMVSETRGFGVTGAATWTYGYDPISGGISETIDPDGHQSFNYYDTQGNLLTQVDNLGQVTSTTYNTLNEPLTLTEAAVVNGAHPITTYCYDNAGNLLSKTRPDPVSSCSNPNPAETVFYHYGGPTGQAGDVTSLTDQANNTTTFTYDSVGDLASQTLPATSENPSGDKTTYSYDTTKGWLLSTVAPKGNAADGNPAAYTTSYAHDPRGPVTTTTDALNHQTVTHYDADGNVAYTVDANNNTTSYTHDPAGELTATVGPAGAATQTTTYWPDGSVEDQIDGLGADTHYTYDALGRVATVTDPDNRSTTYSYDGAGNQLTKQDPGGNCAATPKTGCTTSTYTADNQLFTVTYSDGTTPNITNIGYDGDGRRISMVDGGTATAMWVYDLTGRLTSTTDRNGATVGYGYDTRNNLTSITYPGNKTATRHFDAAGRMDWVKDWNNQQTNVGYDANSNLQTQTVPSTPAVTDTFGYDNADNLNTVTDTQAGNPTPLAALTYTRDPNNQVQTVTATGLPPGNHSYGYTPLSQLSTVDTTGNSYDPAGNPVRLATTATASYDPADQLTASSANSSAQVSGGGYHTAVVRADGSVWVSGLGSSGQAGPAVSSSTIVPAAVTGLPAASAVSAGDAATLVLTTAGTVWAFGDNNYGELGTGSHDNMAHPNPAAVSNLGNQVTAISMGSLGLHALAVKAGTVWAWGYNDLGQLGNGTFGTQVVAPFQVGGITGTVVAVSASRDDSLALTADGHVWGWGANTSGELGDNSANPRYNAEQIPSLSNVIAVFAGLYWSMALKSDGTVWSWGNNSYGQLGHTTSTQTVPTQVGGITTRITAIAGGADHALALGADGSVWAWGLNNVDQVGVVTTPPTSYQTIPVKVINGGATSIAGGYIHSIAPLNAGTVDTWGSDLYGALANSPQLNPTPAPTDANGLAATNTTLTQYSYDNRGNRTTTTPPFGPAATYTYDQANRLTAAGGTTYTYNGDGLRTAKSIAGTTQRMVWDLADSTPLLLSDATNSYIYGPDGAPLEQINNTTGATLWLHHDQQGSTVDLTDNNGNLAGTAAYNPWGQTTATTGTTSPLGYDGQYNDPETGLIYLRARYYDPATAQFLTRDPLDPLTRSEYGYADGNPLNGSDPLGLAAYHYSFDLGSLGSPQDLAAYTRARCSSLFPISGCEDNFSVGQTMHLQMSVLFYTQSFPVKVINETSTSWEFVALGGHPEGQGRTITFSFCTGGNGDTMLHVDTSSNGSILTNWWGIRDVDFLLAHRTWSSFASNIRANYDYSATDGLQPPGVT